MTVGPVWTRLNGRICALIVQTDSEAFRKVLGRLEGDVGGLLALLLASWEADRTQGKKPALTPYWAFARMLFPIAEAIGDLIYRNDKSTVRNLTAVLENEFESVRPGYKGKANVIALMYRHSLTHTDEMRALCYPPNTVNWKLSLGAQSNHLRVQNPATNQRELQFDLTAFYEDLRQVCLNAQKEKWEGKVARRYNEWPLLNLNIKEHKRAISQIERL